MADTTKKASVQIVNEEQENMAVTEVETTEEENKTLIRMNEDDFIQARVEYPVGLAGKKDLVENSKHAVEIAERPNRSDKVNNAHGGSRPKCRPEPAEPVKPEPADFWEL